MLVDPRAQRIYNTVIQARITDRPPDKTRTGSSTEAALTHVMRSLLHRRSKGVCKDPVLGDSDFRLLPRFGHMVVKFLLLCKSWAPNGVKLSQPPFPGPCGSAPITQQRGTYLGLCAFFCVLIERA